MMKNVNCIHLCTKSNAVLDIDHFRWLIERDYHYTFYVDDLPSAWKEEGATVKYENGIPIGSFLEQGQLIVYNHLNFVVQVHETLDDKEAFRIVGFKV